MPRRSTIAPSIVDSQGLGKPQSLVVREAIAEYAARAGQLSERERTEWLRTFDALMPGTPARSAHAVDAEIAEVRAARRHGGRGGAHRGR